MEDKELEPLYVKRREQLKQLVSSIVKPKIVQGKTLNGKDFVYFLQQVKYLIMWLLICIWSVRNISNFSSCVSDSWGFE